MRIAGHTTSVPVDEQGDWLDAEHLAQAIDRLEGQVALAALNPTHIGAVQPDLIAEGFLGEAHPPTQCTHVLS